MAQLNKWPSTLSGTTVIHDKNSGPFLIIFFRFIVQTMFILPLKHFLNPLTSFYLYFGHNGLHHHCLSPAFLLWLPNKPPQILSYPSSLPYSLSKSFGNANFIDVFLHEIFHRIPLVLKTLNLFPWSTRSWISWPSSTVIASVSFPLLISLQCHWPSFHFYCTLNSFYLARDTCSPLCLDQSLPLSWPG